VAGRCCFEQLSIFHGVESRREYVGRTTLALVLRSKNTLSYHLPIFVPPCLYGHMVPHSPICAATWGIIQAVWGINFEATDLDKETLILTLQQLICGRSDGEAKCSSGLRYSPLNLVYLPNGHGVSFDTHPAFCCSDYGSKGCEGLKRRSCALPDTATVTLP
jgi:hypothetical protein